MRVEGKVFRNDQAQTPNEAYHSNEGAELSRHNDVTRSLTDARQTAKYPVQVEKLARVEN